MELLVSITIFLILVGMTIAIVSTTFEAERLRSGASQVQSYLGGARDRAVYAGAPRGVRFILDGNLTEGGQLAATSMVYIQQLEPETGFVNLPLLPVDSRTLRITSSSVINLIQDLRLAGLVAAQPRIRLANGPSSTEGTWYRIASFDANFGNSADANYGRMTLFSDYLFAVASTDNIGFELELLNGVLPNSEPVQLPEGIMIHIDSATGLTSQLPSSSYSAMGGGSFDLLFSPNGGLTGSEASSGIIHLVVCDIKDVPTNLVMAFFGAPTPGNFELVEGGMRVVTIFTRTGQVITNELDPNSGNPFEYALSGEESQE